MVDVMKITLNCLKADFAVCPTCGSKNIVGMGKESCHCGQCSQELEVVFVNKVMNNEEPEDVFIQMSLFSMEE